MTKRSFPLLTGFLFSALLFTSCSQQSLQNCGGTSSVSAYVIGLRQGLGEVSQNEYSQFRLDTLNVYDTISSFSKDEKVSEAAKTLQQDLGDLVRFLDDVQWDVSKLTDSTIAILLVKKLSNDSALSHANQIELALIEKCGVPSSVPGSPDPQMQLPDASFPPVNDTDPAPSATSDEAESTATGKMIASVFGLTLRESEVKCLGEALSGVYDATSDASNIGQYQKQFQKAFDTCAIEFIVPSD